MMRNRYADGKFFLKHYFYFFRPKAGTPETGKLQEKSAVRMAVNKNYTLQ